MTADMPISDVLLVQLLDLPDGTVIHDARCEDGNVVLSVEHPEITTSFRSWGTSVRFLEWGCVGDA